MSIIALLIGILVPVLSRARGAAKDIKCGNNLKQIGIAIMAYGADHDDRMPDSGSDGTSGDLVTRGLKPYFSYSQDSVIETRDFVWLCPKHDKFQWTGYYTSSYGYNVGYMLEPGPTYPHNGYSGFSNLGILATKIQQASKKFVVIDHEVIGNNASLWSYVARPGDPSSDAALDGFGRPDFRHGDRANVLMADGHVEVVEEETASVANETERWDPR